MVSLLRIQLVNPWGLVSFPVVDVPVDDHLPAVAEDQVDDHVHVAVVGVGDADAAGLERVHRLVDRVAVECLVELVQVAGRGPVGLLVEEQQEVGVELLALQRLDDGPLRPRALRDVAADERSKDWVGL
jgi:hypothetical protein